MKFQAHQAEFCHFRDFSDQFPPCNQNKNEYFKLKTLTNLGFLRATYLSVISGHDAPEQANSRRSFRVASSSAFKWFSSFAFFISSMKSLGSSSGGELLLCEHLRRKIRTQYFFNTLKTPALPRSVKFKNFKSWVLRDCKFLRGDLNPFLKNQNLHFAPVPVF